MSTLLDGVKKFQEVYYKDNEQLFKNLANGQAPETLFITCSDSRICPNHLTSTKPGELFVIRNAGNLVEAYNPENPSFEAITLEYAVLALKVKNIVVCGHKKCGAMGAVKDVESLGALPLLQKRIRGLQGYLADAKSEELDDIIDHNVSVQAQNLKSYPFVSEAIKNGSLEIHGWVYDFVSGNVQVVSSEGNDE